MKQQFKFTDLGIRYILDAEIKDGKASFTWHEGSYPSQQDTLSPSMQALVDYTNKWRNNDMKSGDPEQTALLAQHGIADYDEAVRFLKRMFRNEDGEYAGVDWLKGEHQQADYMYSVSVHNTASRILAWFDALYKVGTKQYSRQKSRFTTDRGFWSSMSAGKDQIIPDIDHELVDRYQSIVGISFPNRDKRYRLLLSISANRGRPWGHVWHDFQAADWHGKDIFKAQLDLIAHCEELVEHHSKLINDYRSRCAYWSNENGKAYGTVWFTHPLPKNIETELQELLAPLLKPEASLSALEMFRKQLNAPVKDYIDERGWNDDDWEDAPWDKEEAKVLEELYDAHGEDAWKLLLASQHLELDFTELLEEVEKSDYGYGDALFDVQGTEHYIMTLDETYEAVKEYMEQTIWAFNADWLVTYCPAGVDAEMIRMLQEQCEDSNEQILKLVGGINDHIVGDAMSADGFGHFLNSYDGKGVEIKDLDNKTIIYICRT